MSRSISARRPLGALARRAARDRSGAAAVEFALVAPVLFLLTLGIIEVGMILLEWHRIGEAARDGARVALIEDPIPRLANLAPGTSITCLGQNDFSMTCSPGSASSSTAFATVLATMQGIAPNLNGANIVIEYTDTGITDSSDTSILSDMVTPALTLRVTNYQYQFFFLQSIPGMPSSITLPEFSTTRVVHTTNANNT